MTDRETRPGAGRVLGFAVGGLVVLGATAWSALGTDGEVASSAPTTVVPINPQTGRVYATTSTNVLVTSPPPTVAVSTTIEAPVVGRAWPVEVPAGCDEPPLPDVVFVGTVQATDYRTARYRIDQLRAGSADAYSYEGVIDVRYDIDAKYLSVGGQYLVGAKFEPEIGSLVSRVTAEAPLFGGDDVIGESESNVDCPVLTNPVRTLLTNGRPIDSGVFRPLEESQGRVLRAVLGPAVAGIAIVFGLAALRWFLTGVGWGVSSAVRSARDTPSMRSARRGAREFDRRR